jgi:hypothetical protein
MPLLRFFKLSFNCIYTIKVVLDCKIIYIYIINYTYSKHNGDASPEKHLKILYYRKNRNLE